MGRRCVDRRSLRCGEGEYRIRVELLVGAHPMVELTAARTLMLLSKELSDDRVPVHLIQIGLTGPGPQEPLWP